MKFGSQQTSFSMSDDKVNLRDVQVLTFTKGKFTTGRRTSPVPQLNCIGGSGMGEAHRVETVQCQNMGFDGQDYNWKCTAHLDDDLKLGQTTVSCEGYRSPDDPDVLAGSCGLEYTLIQTRPNPPPVYSSSYRSTSSPPAQQTTTTTTTYGHRINQPGAQAELVLVYLTFIGAIGLIACCIFNIMETDTHHYRPSRQSTTYSTVPPVVPVATTTPVYTTAPQPNVTIMENRRDRDFVDGVFLGSALSGRSGYSSCAPRTTTVHTHTVSTPAPQPPAPQPPAPQPAPQPRESVSFGTTKRR